MDNPTDPNVPVVPPPPSNSGQQGPSPIPVSPPSAPTPTQTVSDNVTTPMSPQPIGQPGSSSRKEAGAATEAKLTESVSKPNWAEADKVAKEENDEYWEKFAAEIKAEIEVKEVGGIEKIEKGEAVVSPELAHEMGIKPVAIPEPVTEKTAFSVRGVSFSDDQISAGMKASSATGVRWLVEWFVLQLLKAHFHIKKSWSGIVERSL